MSKSPSRRTSWPRWPTSLDHLDDMLEVDTQSQSPRGFSQHSTPAVAHISWFVGEAAPWSGGERRAMRAC